MPGQFIKNILTKDSKPGEGTSLQGDFNTLANGVKRTEGLDTKSPVSLVGIVDSNGVRHQPGFTPESAYNYVMGGPANPVLPNNAPSGWYGYLLDSHIDSVNYNNFNHKDTNERFQESVAPSAGNYSTRDTYIAFNDSTSDYFRHRLAIDGLTPIKTAKNTRESWDGGNDASYRLESYSGTPYENEDPVMYGFEFIVDAISSPLLNGAVEDFINSYGNVSEIQARRFVIYDFKKQFQKLFKTKGKIYFDPNAPGSPLQSDAYDSYASSDTQKNFFRPGRKAYLAHYLQKIAGLEQLGERNDTEGLKAFADYPKEKLTLSFFEDVSGTLSTLAHLYKLLYWSIPSGKNIIPENLLRFNCDIVVSEVRNFNRVRKAVSTANQHKGSLEILKDNVSRHIYTLSECQFFFDTRPHEGTVDLSSIKVYGDAGPGLDVLMNYKYSTVKFEKWVPDPEKFGQYVGYNAGAIWKIGNKGAREARDTSNSGTIVDVSNPKFYTVGTNTLKHNGVTTAIQLNKISYSTEDDDIVDPNIGPATGGNSSSGSSAGVGSTKVLGDISKTQNGNSTDELGEDEGILGKKSTKTTSGGVLDSVKQASKKVITNAVKGLANFAIGEINNQILIRTKLLENTINKIKNSLGLYQISHGNVYPKPYTPHSFGPWFDVRNELFNFLTEDIANNLASAEKLANPNAYPDINKINQNKQSNLGQKLSTIYNKNTVYKNINDIKFGGNPSTTNYGDLSNINIKYSNPLDLNNPVGTQDYNQIQFPSPAQKYPTPLSQGTDTTENIVKNNTKWPYPVNNNKFGK